MSLRVSQQGGRVFYGWVIVAIGFVTLLLLYGVRYSFPVFYLPILAEFGWSRASTAAILSANVLGYGLSGPIAGALLDRFGPRKVIPIGAAITALGIVALGQARELWHFYLLFGVVIAFSSCCAGYVANAAVLSNWFVRRRGAAFGITFAGISTSYLTAPFAQYLISHLGWRWAYVVLGAMVFAIVVPITALFQRHRPQEMGLLPDGMAASVQGNPSTKWDERKLVVNEKWARTEWTLTKAARTYRFWLLFLVSLSLFGIAESLIITHQVAFAVDVGYSEMFAASVFGLSGVAGSLGRVSGFLSDRLGREKTFTFGIFGIILAVGVLLSTRDATHPWALYLYAMLFGLSAGLVVPTFTASVADLFQGKNFGSINGLVVAGYGIGGGIGPWLGGYIFDVTGSYDYAFILIIFVIALACAFEWIAAPRKVRLVAGKRAN